MPGVPGGGTFFAGIGGFGGVLGVRCQPKERRTSCRAGASPYSFLYRTYSISQKFEEYVMNGHIFENIFRIFQNPIDNYIGM